MKNALRIADNFGLPIDAVTQTFAILAKRGTGKTYTASVMAEEMLKARQPIIALDPTGAWWGLRSEYPVVIIGGEHADVPLEESAGEVIARAVVENRFSAVIDLSLLRKGQMIRFVIAFAESLYRLNRDPVHLFVDEADAFAPQGRSGFGVDESRMLGAMEDIVRRGRKRGIGCTLITQRPAVLNKNVLTQAECLVALRLVHPKDIDAVEEWVNVHADPKQAKIMVDSLPSLPIGTAWFWSPGWGNFFERVAVRRRETFDSGATPKPGEKVKAPAKLAAVDLAKLGDQIKATVEKAKADDPAALRRRIADLERELNKPVATVQSQRVEVPVITDKQLTEMKTVVSLIETAAKHTDAAWKAFEKVGATWQEAIDHVQGRREANTVPKVLPISRAPAPSPIVRPTSCDAPAVGNGGLRRILIALAQRPGLTNRQIGLRAGLSSQSGTFSTYLGRARSSGWIRDEGERRFITDEGLTALGEYQPLPTGPALLQHWLGELGSGGVSRILQVLADAYPESLSNEQIGERAGISAASGTFSTYMGRLRGLELVEGGRGATRASSELFD